MCPERVYRCWGGLGMLRGVNARIISIGTELTYGLTVDTNAAWLSQRLAAIGVPVTMHVTVPDDAAVICDVVRRAASGATVVLVTGGLGPTADDVTRGAVADAAGKPLVVHARSLDRIRGYCERIERTMPASNEVQALLPDGADAIDNDCGTAPGFQVCIAEATVFVMPGVPHEMRAMYERAVAPRIAEGSSGGAIVTRTLRCFGAGEATMAERIADLMVGGRNPQVGITASEGVISVRIIARGLDPDDARSMADGEAALVRDRLGRYVFGQEEQTLQEAVAALLGERRLTVSTAESCTGGLLAKMLTDVPGSSGYFTGGFVAYANEEKARSLGVTGGLIDTHGAVSEQVAAAMAEGCRRVTGADLALSTTGIAGPTGGSPDKPVGLVYIARADASETAVRRLNLGGHLTRAAIRDRACKAVLNFLRLHFLSGDGMVGRSQRAD